MIVEDKDFYLRFVSEDMIDNIYTYLTKDEIVYILGTGDCNRVPLGLTRREFIQVTNFVFTTEALEELSWDECVSIYWIAVEKVFNLYYNLNPENTIKDVSAALRKLMREVRR